MSDHIQNLREFVDAKTSDRTSFRLLEAGCGSCSWLDLSDRAFVVGVDISGKQLERNSLLHEAIEADIMKHRFDPASFDVIVSIDVLEHLDRPQDALTNLRDALAPGGLLVLKIPNAMSWKGLFTKFTPHGLHVWVYRKFLGRPNAGTDDVGPFKTFMRMSIRPDAMRNWARRVGLSVAYEDYYESNAQIRLRRKLGPLDLLVKLVDGLSRLLSFGRFSLSRTEYVIALQNGAVAVEDEQPVS